MYKYIYIYILIRNNYFTIYYFLNNKFVILISEEDAKQSMLYSYKHSFSGFSAILNSSQVAFLASNIVNPFFFQLFPLLIINKVQFYCYLIKN